MSEEFRREIAAAPDSTLPPEPELEDGLVGIWECWWRLSAGRNYISSGFSAAPQPIRWESVLQWCEFLGMSHDEVYLYDKCVQAMDKVYLNWSALQAKLNSQPRGQ